MPTVAEIRKAAREVRADLEKALYEALAAERRGGETDEEALERLCKGDDPRARAVRDAYERVSGFDPLVKSAGEVRRAEDELDAYVRKSLQSGETLASGHDRLAAGGDPEYGRLYLRSCSSRV